MHTVWSALPAERYANKNHLKEFPYGLRGWKTADS